MNRKLVVGGDIELVVKDCLEEMISGGLTLSCTTRTSHGVARRGNSRDRRTPSTTRFEILGASVLCMEYSSHFVSQSLQFVAMVSSCGLGSCWLRYSTR